MCFWRNKKRDLDNYKTIEELKNINALPTQYRNKIRICVIDDEGFDPKGLIKLGYTNIETQKFTKPIDKYGKYDVILCDVLGLAHDISVKEEGYAFAKELNKNYPFCTVVLFTAQNPNNFPKDNPLKVIRKPKTPAELVREIDRLIEDIIDPKKLWLKVYHYLLDSNVRPKDIVIIEDNFVRMYENSNETKELLPAGLLASNDQSMKDNLRFAAELVGILTGSAIKEACTQ